MDLATTLFSTKVVIAERNLLLSKLIALAKPLFAKCFFFCGLWWIFSTISSSKEVTLLGIFPESMLKGWWVAAGCVPMHQAERPCQGGETNIGHSFFLGSPQLCLSMSSFSLSLTYSPLDDTSSRTSTMTINTLVPCHHGREYLFLENIDTLWSRMAW